LDAIVQLPKKGVAKAIRIPSKQTVSKMLQIPVNADAVRQENINEDNRLTILAAKEHDKDSKTRVYRCLTHYRGRPVHLQWIHGPVSLEAAARAQIQGAFNDVNFNAPNQQPAIQNRNRRDERRD
ncbi:MAG: hypothetical protein AAFU85_34565, partial [Planctomycetota bacterium]